MQITPLSGLDFAAEVTGLPAGAEVDGAGADRLREALLRHAVLCLRTDGLTPQQYLRLARIFGTPKMQLLRDIRREDEPLISMIVNGKTDDNGGKRIYSGSHWHTDDSYLEVPCALTMLHAEVIPTSGGDTLFANMTRARRELPAELDGAVAGREAQHRYRSRRNVAHVQQRSAEEEMESPPARHPLIRVHPETGNEAVYLNPNRIERIEDMPLDVGDALLDRLLDHCTQDHLVYRHKWRVGDVVVWDNRCTMHKASTDYGDAARRMARILIEGTRPVGPGPR